MKKSYMKLGIVVAVIIAIMGIMFMFNSAKDSFRILNENSAEVSSKMDEIRDYRKLKGYKVLESSRDSQVLLISAGLTYGEEDTVEIESVDFGKNDITVVVKENLKDSPENEVISYPSVIVEIDSSLKGLVVKNTDGDIYEEMQLHKSDDEVDKEEPKEEIKNEEIKTDEVKNENKDENKEQEDSKEEPKKDEVVEDQNKEEEPKKETGSLTVEFQGKIDTSSIEVKYGETYMVFDISSMGNSFPQYEMGTKINLTYEQVGSSFKAIAVKPA